MRRFLTVLATAAVVGAMAVSSPASAAAAKGPKLGSWTCAGEASEVPFATFELFKGNKYAANGDTEKAKYVYKAGKQKLKFKSGVWEDLFYGVYDKDAKTVTLHNFSDDTTASTCSRDADEVAPTP